MRQYFTRDRLGRPKVFAGLLLLAFLAQALWLVRMELSIKSKSPLYGPEEVRLVGGWRQWHGDGIAGVPHPNTAGKGPVHSDNPSHYDSRLDAASSENPEGGDVGTSEDGFDTEHSPLLPVATAAPLLLLPQSWFHNGLSDYWRWLARLPFLACGLLLGASLWYVARRLCGNTGGLVALTLYCFSPSLIQASAVWHTEPEIVAAWGAFGTIFTAIAVAHTLYAPREVVLWNWRRIVLLGVALAIAVGAQFSMIVLLPLALIFLLYVAPVRRQAGSVIWLAACVAGFLLLFAMYFLHPHAFAGSMRHAIFWGATWGGFTVAGLYKQVAMELGRACPAFAVVLPVTVVTYAVWPRTRYFGNTAPLLVGLLFVILGMAHPHSGGEGFLLAAVPFLLIFVSGVLADLMETRLRPLVTAGVLGMLAAYVGWCIYSLSLVVPG